VGLQLTHSAMNSACFRDFADADLLDVQRPHRRTDSAAGARVTPGIGIPTTAGVGSRSRTTPTTAAPSHGVGGYEKRCHAGGYSENEYFAQHSNINRFSR
jgi:hypothetical protein